MDYAEILAIAVELIDDAGRDVVMQQLSATAADANKPWKGPGTATVASSVNTKACFVPPSGTDFGREFFDSELLKRCEQVALVAGNATDLSAFTTILDNNQRWKIEWVQELKPGDTTVLYAFGVKR